MEMTPKKYNLTYKGQNDNKGNQTQKKQYLAL